MITKVMYNYANVMREVVNDIADIVDPVNRIDCDPEITIIETKPIDPPLHHLAEFEEELYELRFMEFSDALIIYLFSGWLSLIIIVSNTFIYNEALLLTILFCPILWFIISLKFRKNEEANYHLSD